MKKIVISKKTDNLRCPKTWETKSVKGCVTCPYCFGIVSHSHVNCTYKMPSGPKTKD